MSLVALQLLDGSAVSVEATQVTSTLAIPAALLPAGIAAGTRLSVAGVIYDVLGAKATVDAAIEIGLGWQTVLLANDVAYPTGAPGVYADVTGLAFAMVAGARYAYEIFILYTTNATGTGTAWAVNGPALTSLFHLVEWGLTATSNSFSNGIAAYDLPAAPNGTSPSTGANIAYMSGVIIPSAAGNLIARGMYENSGGGATATAKAGSYIRYKRLS